MRSQKERQDRAQRFLASGMKTNEAARRLAVQCDIDLEQAQAELEQA